MTAALSAAAACALALPAAAAAQAPPVFDFQPGFTAQAVDIVDPVAETFEEVTQAGAHPDMLMLDFKVTTKPGPWAPEPVEPMKDIRIELPPGMVGNPEATPKCPMHLFAAEKCPAMSMVGFHELDYNGSRGTGMERSSLYNVEPPAGVVARFAMKVLPVPVVLDMRVASDGRYTITSDISNVHQGLQFLGSRTYLFGTPAAMNGPGDFRGVGGPSAAPQVPLLTLGTECGAPKTVKIRGRSWTNQDRWIETSYTPASGLTGCDKLSFDPKLDLRPTTTQAATPAGLAVRVDVPQTTSPDGLATPNVRKVDVLMPEGVAISPGGAQGLAGCTDEQVALRSLSDPACPGASRVGSVRIETPVLEGPLEGSVYIGTPKSQDAQTGEMFRVFLAASGYDVTIKQEGRIVPDPVTGRLRAVFDETPQLPFSSMQVTFNDGPRAPLATPSTCGTFTTTANVTSWSGSSVTSDSRFEIACRAGLGAFAPTFSAGTAQATAGASSPFLLRIGKADGQSDLNGLRMTLPKGLLATVKGNLGTQVGTARVAAGTGAEPLWLSGPVVLEGPYGDAPFSLKVTVPAKAGPYDLGDVVVRQKIYIDPIDAHVTIVSDPLPTILQGVPVRLQHLTVDVDKPGFMRNPTSCEPGAIAATLGAATGQTAQMTSRFQVGDCAGLKLTPSLAMELTDEKELTDGKHPGLRALLTQPGGQANLRKVRVRLPLSLALDPDNAQALCEFADGTKVTPTCPAGSIVGSATAVTPILDQPLTGPVYFVKNIRRNAAGREIRTLPKLVIPLTGQGVKLTLTATSTVEDDHLIATFDAIPDAPVSAFELKLAGGANGILAVTGGDDASVCKQDNVAEQQIDGQNGKAADASVRLATPCGVTVLRRWVTKSGLKVQLGGLGAGTVTVRGSGLKTTRRTIRQATVATVTVPFTTAGRRAYDQRRTITASASFDPAGAAAPKSVRTTLRKGKPAAARRR